jgi:membrane-associated phospholipid phosphatase
MPWTSIIYSLGVYFIIILAFLSSWRNKYFTILLISLIIASSISFLFYWLLPIKIVRPAYDGTGISLLLMRLITQVDNPANCFPSSHCIFAVISSMTIHSGLKSAFFKILIWIFCISICVSTITVGQHYFIDVLGGVIIGVMSHYMAIRIYRRV